MRPIGPYEIGYRAQRRLLLSLQQLQLNAFKAMKIIYRASCATITAALLTSCCTSSALKDPPKAVFHVSDLVADVQTAIDPFFGSQSNGLPQLSSVKLALQTVQENRITGEADYLIVAVKGYYDNAFTQEMDLTLVPQSVPHIFSLATGPTITEALHDAIASAQTEIKATYGKGPHALSTQEIDVQISFAVTLDFNAGVAKWSIVPISITASDEISKKTTNTITVTFKNPTPAGS